MRESAKKMNLKNWNLKAKLRSIACQLGFHEFVTPEQREMWHTGTTGNWLHCKHCDIAALRSYDTYGGEFRVSNRKLADMQKALDNYESLGNIW